MHICFITNKYPNCVEPNAIVFLQQLVGAIAKKGIHCSVICPVPTNLNRKYKMLPLKKTELNENAEVDIYFPRYFGLGQSSIGFFNPARITTSFFSKAVDKVLSSFGEKPDYLYSHFVTPAGITAARLGYKYNIPAYMAYGEATLNTINHFGYSRVKKELQYLNGVIAVSSQNKEMISSFVRDEIVEVFPNGIDESLFVPQDRDEARQKYNITRDAFVVAFLGSFDNRKGINRLSEAMNKIEEEDVYLICAGKGALVPSTDKCIFHNSVLHSDLPMFLSAADIFVLPTLNEGCCNAIIEAMACGLPIVSSNRSFNDDILDETNSLLIDPTKVDEIFVAIKTLYKNKDLRKKLSDGSLRKAKELTLTVRSQKILEFMEKMR